MSLQADTEDLSTKALLRHSFGKPLIKQVAENQKTPSRKGEVSHQIDSELYRVKAASSAV